MLPHLLRVSAAASCIARATSLPFPPGLYDGLAAMLSGTAQFLEWMGLPLVPVAIMWLAVAGEEPAPAIDGGILVGRGSPPADRHPVNAFACTIGVASVDDYVAKPLAAGGALASPER